MNPTILLQSGAYLDILNPDSSNFTIEDIAQGLSNTCRFAGQCREFYSVAEHSICVSRCVPKPDAYAGLMHDAAEAFIHDISRPLKVLLADYQVIEERVEAAVFRRFDVPNPLPSSVKEIDTRMLITEQRQLMRNGDNWNYGLEPLTIYLPRWSPADAYQQFLKRFWQLRPA